MVDQWEKDSLIALNNRAKCNLKLDNSLRKEAYYYALSMNGWKEVNPPEWIREATEKWYSPNSVVSGMFEKDNIQYSVRRVFGSYEFWPYHYEINCSMRTKLFGCASFHVGQGHIISSCYCPHWTSPQLIAEYLDKSIDYSLYKKGAIAIYNDDICTYAVLACKK